MRSVPLIDLSGKRFGRWTVIKRVMNCRHLCKCDCGTEKWIRNSNLLQGHSTSCGCKRIGQQRIPFYERFWSKVEKTDTCWLWKGSLNNHGYGQFTIRGRPVGAHRISWELENGKIPVRLFVCHKCDNPLCVNPSHMFLGNHADNSRDMSNKKRSTWGEKSILRKLSERDVLDIKNMLIEGISRKIICEKFGVIDKTIRNIMNKKTWRHI